MRVIRIGIALALVIFTAPSSAQLLMSNVGPGSFGGTALPACAGSFDLTLGCNVELLN